MLLNLEVTLRRIRSSPLAQNTAWITGGNAARLGLQAFYFVLIARALGPNQFGSFVGAVALIGIVSPFAGIGFGLILIKNTARDRTHFAESWGNALFMTVSSGLMLLLLMVLVARFLIGDKISAHLILLVAAADLIFLPIVGLSGQAFQAFEKLSGTASTQVVLALCRTGGALVLLVPGLARTASTWASLYLLSSACAALYGLGLVTRNLGRPRLALSKISADLAEGSYFAVGVSSQTIYNDIDKTMLVRLSDASAAGIYATAYRLLDTSFQPVRAVLAAAYARFFRAGEDGIGGSMKVVRKLLPYAAGYGVLAALFLYSFAPAMPYILGRGFADSVAALRWLAPIAVIRCIHYFAADSLSGAGYQAIRAFVQFLIAVANIGLNFWLIPIYSWRGAAWASLACDGALAVALWTACFLLLRSSQRVEFAEVRGNI